MRLGVHSPSTGATRRTKGGIQRERACARCASPHPSIPAVTGYARAALGFVDDATHALITANARLVGRAPRRSVESVPVVRYSIGSQTLEEPPVGVQTTVEITVDAIRGADFDELITTVATTAMSLADQMERQLLEHVGRLADATGNSVDAADRDPIDAIIDALEAVEMSIDDDGALSLPTLVIGQGASLPQPTPEQHARLADVLRRKEEQARARRPDRRLR